MLHMMSGYCPKLIMSFHTCDYIYVWLACMVDLCGYNELHLYAYLHGWLKILTNYHDLKVKDT